MCEEPPSTRRRELHGARGRTAPWALTRPDRARHRPHRRWTLPGPCWGEGCCVGCLSISKLALSASHPVSSACDKSVSFQFGGLFQGGLATPPPSFSEMRAVCMLPRARFTAHPLPSGRRGIDLIRVLFWEKQDVATDGFS